MIPKAGQMAIDYTAAAMSASGVGAIFGALLKGFTAMAEALENPGPTFASESAVSVPMLWLVPDMMRVLVQANGGMAEDRPRGAANIYKLSRVYAGMVPPPPGKDADAIRAGDVTAFEMADADALPADPTDPMTSAAYWRPVFDDARMRASGPTPSTIRTQADATAELAALRHLYQTGAIGKWRGPARFAAHFGPLIRQRYADLRRLAGDKDGPDPTLDALVGPPRDPRLAGPGDVVEVGKPFFTFGRVALAGVVATGIAAWWTLWRAHRGSRNRR